MEPSETGKTALSELITVAITSCARHDLLEQTLRSLDQTADLPLQETIIIEDSDAPQPNFLGNFARLGKITWLSNGRRVGQIMSIDRLYDHIKTPYIFHCEDDWDFSKTGYLQQSLSILKDWRQIWSVSLRGNTCNGHPNIKDNFFPFEIQEPYWMGYWGGMNFNPGLRRLSDWKRIRSYGQMVGYNLGGCHHEAKLSTDHLNLNYRIAVLPEEYVTHTGHLRSQASQPLPKQPKVLIAIPACWKYEYGTHDSGIQRVTGGRTEAQRNTWIKDVKNFSNVDYRYFYGNPKFGELADGGVILDADEVFLNVPDDYEHLPEKMKAIYRYALERGYDYVYKCDDDTFVYVDRLMRSGFEECDQMGFANCPHGLTNCLCYITGGAGYTLSRKAIELVLNAPTLPENNPHRWAEDYVTGQALRQNGVIRRGHPGFLPGMENHYVDVDKALASGFPYIGLHAVKPEGMVRLHQGI